MAHLIVGVLGGLQVWIKDVPVSSFESDKVRALLAYLVVEANRSHRRETLIGLLWPDFPEEAARHNLRQALFNLRLAIGDHTTKPPYLLITRDAIQINRESDYSLDLDQFNAYFSAWKYDWGRESVYSSNHLLQLEEMVHLYRGEFLQQFYLEGSTGYEEWILAQREAFRQRMMDALICLANQYEQQEDFQNARSYALRQLELDPWREEAHCQLMRLFALDGQRSFALAQYESCRKVLAEELGVEPSLQTRELYEQIRLGTLKRKVEQPLPAPSSSIHNLPASSTPFIGREKELTAVGQLIADPECRCINLVGPGGIGKTRLALRAAELHSSQFTSGTAFVPLASISSIEEVIPAMASAVDFTFFGPIDPKVQLLNYLKNHRMLLIVDNVEHLLVEGAHPGTIAELLIEILQQADQVKLLVTSREAMNIQGEWLFEVQGLTVPKLGQRDGLDEYSAIALFVQRARRVQPKFEMNADEKLGIVHLCRMVEGLPLAIELAAAWVRILSPMEIAKEIETSLDFLNAQIRDLPERHRSMRAVFDHSWQMLSTEEKQVLSKLSVFQGGFQRQAAEQVASASLQTLSSLVIRSLLRRTAAGRYDLHELIRQYSTSKLSEDPGKLHTVYEAHSRHYLRFLEEKGVNLQSHDQKQVVADLTGEMDNIRAAWKWSVDHHQFIPLANISASLWYLFELLNWFKEGERTFRETADALRISTSESEADAAGLIAWNTFLAHYGYFLLRLGRGEEAYAVLAQSAAFLRTSTNPIAATNSLFCLGIVCWGMGRYSEAEESFRESLRFAREYEIRWYEAMVSEFLGRVAFETGAYNQARKYLYEALAILRQLGDPSMRAHLLSYLGRTMEVLGEYGEAEKLLQESLELAREIGYRLAVGLAIDGLGRVAYSQGRHEEAEANYSISTEMFREMGDLHRLSRTLNHRGLNLLSQNNAEGAQQAFKAALKMAYEGGWKPAALYALTGLTALGIPQKTSQETLELVYFILQHPASAQETKDIATRLQVKLQSDLTQVEIETVQERSKLKSLDELVTQFLAGDEISSI